MNPRTDIDDPVFDPSFIGMIKSYPPKDEDTDMEDGMATRTVEKRA